MARPKKNKNLFKKERFNITQFMCSSLYAYEACNEIEKILYLGLLEHGILVRPQFEVGRRRLDFAWTLGRKKIGIEINGSEYHTGLENELRDHERDLELTKEGWEMIYLTGKDVWHNLNECIQYIIEKIGPLEERAMKNMYYFPGKY